MRVQRRVLGALPVKVSSAIDLPLIRSRPFNGQERRIEIVREIAETFGIQRVVETGTFRGSSTGLMLGMFGKPVASVEADPRFHAYAQRQIGHLDKVDLTLGDSRSFLRDLAARQDWTTWPTFFYLDAHWEHDLPLADELEIIAAAWPRAVVMVDDFEVPDDPGYGFDDYGGERALTAAYLPHAVADWGLFYPAAASSEETGSRRGCCVLVSPAFADGPDLKSLRPV